MVLELYLVFASLLLMHFALSLFQQFNMTAS